MASAPLYGRPKSLSLGQAASPRYAQEWWARVVADTFLGSKISPEDLQKLNDALYQQFSTAQHYAVFPDAVAAIEQLAARHIPMAVISNGDCRIAGVSRDVDDSIASHMACVLTSYDFGEEKPSPRIWERVMNITGVADRGSVLHIGDHLDSDYFGPLKNGFQAAFLRRRASVQDGEAHHSMTTEEILARWRRPSVRGSGSTDIRQIGRLTDVFQEAAFDFDGRK